MVEDVIVAKKLALEAFIGVGVEPFACLGLFGRGCVGVFTRGRVWLFSVVHSERDFALDAVASLEVHRHCGITSTCHAPETLVNLVAGSRLLLGGTFLRWAC